MKFNELKEHINTSLQVGDLSVKSKTLISAAFEDLTKDRLLIMFIYDDLDGLYGKVYSLQCVINEYIVSEIIERYSGELPAGFNAMTFLANFDSVADYESDKEYEAAAEIYNGLNNLHYAELAIKASFAK